MLRTQKASLATKPGIFHVISTQPLAASVFHVSGRFSLCGLKFETAVNHLPHCSVENWLELAALKSPVQATKKKN